MLTLFLILVILATTNAQKTWCGKNYLKGEPVVEPGGQYPVPAYVSEPLLLFRCSPAVKPYIQSDDHTAAVLVDLELTHFVVNGTSRLSNTIYEDPRFLVQISTEGIPILTARVLPLGTNQELHFPLLALEAREKPYDIKCTAQLVRDEKIAFKASTSLLYLLPSPYGGSVVKQDVRMKALLIQKNGSWIPFIPFGFFVSFDDYLARNLSVLDAAVEKGYNLVHPVPTFGNLVALEEVLDYMENLGLWLMYDMRWSYNNATAVEQEVNRIKHRTNLLLWYTADEPDGCGDDRSAPQRSYDQIYDLDGYHPVSLTLNCGDYYFRSYSSADIILSDTYPIGVNMTYSLVYHTPCNFTYGCCGCDNCLGDGKDVPRRLSEFYERLIWDGRKEVGVWSVVQAFGEQSFWPRFPTLQEFVSQAVVSLNHGARGIVPWVEPTTKEITKASSLIAHALPSLEMFLLHPRAEFRIPGSAPAALDIATWSVDSRTLVLATNLDTSDLTFTFAFSSSGLSIIFDVGSTVRTTEQWVDILLSSQASVGFILYNA